MKNSFLVVSVVVVSLIFAILMARKNGPMKLYLLIAIVLVASIILGILFAR